MRRIVFALIALSALGLISWYGVQLIGGNTPLSGPAAINSNIVDFAKWMQTAMGESPDVMPAAVLKLARVYRRCGTATGAYRSRCSTVTTTAAVRYGWILVIFYCQRLKQHALRQQRKQTEI